MTQTNPLASLPMYDWPEVHAETDAQWQTLRAVMNAVDLPETLTRPDSGPYKLNDHWRDPALVFSQCCWGPLDVGMIDYLIPLAQPDYGAWPGGRGPFYRSAMVVRKGEGIPAPLPSGPIAELPAAPLKGRRFAYNDTESLSGYRGLAADLAADPATLAAQTNLSGGHRNSVRMVAQGEADTAVIDCRSWALAQRFEPEAASQLDVIGWTGEQLGIAYVTSRATDPAMVAAMREALLAAGCHPVPPR
ncbi:PhnD/SsuA/transferrin family substrate-binding protein [Rhodobacter sp. NTK016B]|uniref:phosphate/phosphite/phosphonate ABC transporter substrate-binding protein n=1 Tax=Rhodobacter sp. NTK016B TaxID=2759676 RepID=UPI001A8F5B25|nr:PhnD/SsuA/transferrin family substrate-binding protein [Rhodobacter sp. NTK016B]MBN8293647.1 PhnD/SsuA/transferrin family substrate-binding protein [Rhodobacter sp. NTK016B]